MCRRLQRCVTTQAAPPCDANATQVREYVATLRGVDLASVATLIVVPNVPVLDQWRDALLKSGVAEDQAPPLPSPFCTPSAPLCPPLPSSALLCTPCTPCTLHPLHPVRLLHPRRTPMHAPCTLHTPLAPSRLPPAPSAPCTPLPPTHTPCPYPPPHPSSHQVLRFKGDFTKAGLEAPRLRGRPPPRVVILRKHQLQSEQQGVFHHLADPLVADAATPAGAAPGAATGGGGRRGGGGGGGGGGGSDDSSEDEEHKKSLREEVRRSDLLPVVTYYP